VIGFVAVLATGYVLGTKAGRQRYEQIASAARTVAGHPATKTVIDAGRRKIAEKVSPDPPVVNLSEIDYTSRVIEPRRDAATD